MLTGRHMSVVRLAVQIICVRCLILAWHFIWIRPGPLESSQVACVGTWFERVPHQAGPLSSALPLHGRTSLRHVTWIGNSGSQRQGCVAARSAAESSLPPAHLDSEHTVIIFDWDDTFLPSSYIKAAVLPALPAGAIESLDPLGVGNGPAIAKHVQEFTRLAGIVREVLVTARKFGHVAIITGARKVMMNRNAQQFLPGLNLPELMSEHGIVSYHTFNSASAGRRRGWEDDGLDKWVMAKAASISKYVRATLDEESSQQWNVISIGDGYEERDATRKLFGSQLLEPDEHAALEEIPGAGAFKQLRVNPLVKTVKLLDNSNTDSLCSQLQVLLQQLPEMVASKSSFDFDMAKSTDVGIF